MRLDYISFSNLVDWGLYGLAVIFVINFDVPYHTEGCTNDKVNFQKIKWLAHSFFPEVLAVAGWILLTNLLLAEPSRILQTASFFWNIHHHVHGHPQDYIQIFCCSIGFYHCIWIRISHCIYKPGKTQFDSWRSKEPIEKAGSKLSYPISGTFIKSKRPNK